MVRGRPSLVESVVESMGGNLSAMAARVASHAVPSRARRSTAVVIDEEASEYATRMASPEELEAMVASVAWACVGLASFQLVDLLLQVGFGFVKGSHLAANFVLLAYRWAERGRARQSEA